MRDIVKQRIERDYEIVSSLDATVDDMKSITCKFFRKGKHPDCYGCDQNEDKVKACNTTYISRIMERPMTEWDASFSEIKPAEELKSIQEANLGLNCNDCYIGEKCPLYKAASACSIEWNVPQDLINNTNSLMDYLIGIQMKRVQRALVHEEMDGGVPDQNLSAEMDRLQEMIQAKADLNTVKITQKTTMNIPGQAVKEGGGTESILSKIFGKTSTPKLDQPAQAQLPESTPRVEDLKEGDVTIITPPKNEAKRRK